MSDLNQLLTILIQYQVLLKMYHWQTNAYVSHKATDELYSQLSEFIDHLVEYQSYTIYIKPTCIKLNNMYDDQGKEFLLSLQKVLVSISTSDQGIRARRDDLIGYIDQALYLIRLV